MFNNGFPYDLNHTLTRIINEIPHLSKTMYRDNCKSKSNLSKNVFILGKKKVDYNLVSFAGFKRIEFL